MSACAEVIRRLARLGILPLQDKRLPSVVGIFTGRPIDTSWWGIPEGREIFGCLARLDRDGALATRLVGGKVTYVHRRLWPALVGVGAARAEWQTRRLSADARRLLTLVDRGESPTASGEPARELQDRLLVVAREVHMPSGHHEVRLEGWQRWAARVGVAPLFSVEEARQQLEDAAARLGAAQSALPWHRRQPSGRRRASNRRNR